MWFFDDLAAIFLLASSGTYHTATLLGLAQTYYSILTAVDAVLCYQRRPLF